LGKEITKHFDDLISLARTIFIQVGFVKDMTPERSILRLRAEYGQYRIVVSELFSDDIRKYSFYVLHEDRIEAGFDNAADIHAIRLKYGHAAKEHFGELVPHLHLKNKTELFLTDEMTFEDFTDWLRLNLKV